MNAEEAEKAFGKKIKGYSEDDDSSWFYVMFLLNHGKQMVMRSKSPIFIEVEQEQ